MKEEITNPPTQVNLIIDDYNIFFELSLFVTNIRRKFVVFWNLSLLFKIDTKKENITT